MSKRTYAIWWTEGDGTRRSGKLELNSTVAFVSGRGSERITLQDAESIEYARGELTVHLASGRTIQLGSLDAPGALREAALRLQATMYGA